MRRLNFIMLIAALCSFTISCAGDNSDTSTPPAKDETTIELSQSSATNTSVEVSVALANADVAYCRLCEAGTATPSLSSLRDGQKLSESGKLTFEGLEAGYSYKVYGIAGRNGIYTNVVGIDVKTSGEIDYNFPTGGVEAFTTTASKSMLMKTIEAEDIRSASDKSLTITIDNTTRYQSMEGFGPAITGSAAYNLLKMNASERDRLLREAFHPTEGLGYNYVRISIGCSDFSLREYTWCDQEGLEFFAVHPDDSQYLFPVLREILAINPDVKIIAAPWTAPLWMKIDRYSNKPYDKWAGGKLNPDYYDEYAQYLVMWVEEMELNGFKIESITPQNEPLHDGNSASTYMSWEQQRNFIKNHLGPAFEAAGLDTKIWIYDHNFDVTDFVKNIYADKEASKYVEGSAWHAYGGSSSALAQIYKADPTKSIYFTEQSIGTWCPNFGDNLLWHIREVCLGTINNYCRAVVLWNFMLDAERGPNRPGGCTTCYGFVDCDASYSYSTLTFRSHWYAIGHMSKVVKRNAVRIKCSGSVTASAFENPDGTIAAVMLNDSEDDKQVVVKSPKGDFVVTLAARSVTSLVW
uniref:glycoside hydrolase family 30 protein n=1 Tax=Alistipes sp. TaxID=1872444 RepID=UPI0040562FBF